MRRDLAIPSALALATAAAFALPVRLPAASPADDDPAAIFAGRCAGCHAVPDPALRTDRAWLDQVRRTA